MSDNLHSLCIDIQIKWQHLSGLQQKYTKTAEIENVKMKFDQTWLTARKGRVLQAFYRISTANIHVYMD